MSNLLMNNILESRRWQNNLFTESDIYKPEVPFYIDSDMDFEADDLPLAGSAISVYSDNWDIDVDMQEYQEAQIQGYNTDIPDLHEINILELDNGFLSDKDEAGLFFQNKKLLENKIYTYLKNANMDIQFESTYYTIDGNFTLYIDIYRGSIEAYNFGEYYKCNGKVFSSLHNVLTYAIKLEEKIERINELKFDVGYAMDRLNIENAIKLLEGE